MRAVLLGLVVSVIATACADSGSAVAGDGTTSSATRPLPLTDPADTPAVDRQITTVDPAQIHFDTFDGGSVPLDRAGPELIARLFDAIAPIDAPDYQSVDAADEWLRADDVVVGYIDPRGGAWAFPVRILNFHEIVNDEWGVRRC